MCKEWSYSIFSGDPPEGFDSWTDWVCSPKKQGVFVQALAPGTPTTVEKLKRMVEAASTLVREDRWMFPQGETTKSFKRLTEALNALEEEE